ncbi:hypothetical protein NDA12_001118 [Ustilago hordei]|nr:hypothetical protein NDA15_003594 [Ustilago hordei]KAJ1587828.1 hypothetical protein NDA12_001118 [Ustilago hordei]UTT93863.1 hypothetical protein NDA17_006461 [Ustilago hordei]
MCLHNQDVVKLGKELDSIWNDAAHLGKHFDEDLKKSTLYHCTAQDWFYTNSVNVLKTAKPDSTIPTILHQTQPDLLPTWSKKQVNRDLGAPS